MTHTQRIRAVLEGKPVDRVPITAWGPHLNLEDRNVNDFSKAIISYQNQHDFDVLKVMQNGLYNTEDFGQIIAEPENSDDAGFKKTVKAAFNSLEDWKTVTKRDVHKGVFGREMQSVKIICEYYKDTVPVLPTIFGPTRMLTQLSGYAPGADIYPPSFVGDSLFAYVREHEDVYFHVMDVLAEQIIDLMNGFLDAGAAGFFYCPGGDHKDFCTDEEYLRYVRPYDERALNAVKDRSWFTMLHICGMEVQRMEQMVTLPAQAVNWEDQAPSNPSLAQVRAMTDKVLMGGIDRNSDFYGANREQVKAVLRRKAEEAVCQGGARLIAATGCECNREVIHRFAVWNEVMRDIAEGK